MFGFYVLFKGFENAEDWNNAPTNLPPRNWGLNCSSCMKLDILVRGSPKGYLVNQGGLLTKVTPSECYCGSFFGRVDMFHDGFCGPTNGPACPDCKKLFEVRLPYMKRLES